MIMLSDNEKALRNALTGLVSILDNVSDTRREYCSGATDASTWRAVEDGLAADLKDLEAAIVKARSSVSNLWINRT